MLRAQYSLLIVRFVNGVVDSLQKGRIAASVSSLASIAGVPRLLVDLRHETTHNELPSLAALRAGARHALAWLRESYWEQQKQHIRESLRKIDALIKEFFASQIAAARKSLLHVSAGTDTDGDEIFDDRGFTAKKHSGNLDGSVKDDPTPSSNYSAVNEKRRRQDILGSLKARVPRPLTCLLISGFHEALVFEMSNRSDVEDRHFIEIIGKAVQNTIRHFEKEWSGFGVIFMNFMLESLVDICSIARKDEEKLTEIFKVATFLEIMLSNRTGANSDDSELAIDAILSIDDMGLRSLIMKTLGAYSSVLAQTELWSMENVTDYLNSQNALASISNLKQSLSLVTERMLQHVQGEDLRNELSERYRNIQDTLASCKTEKTKEFSNELDGLDDCLEKIGNSLEKIQKRKLDSCTNQSGTGPKDKLEANRESEDVSNSSKRWKKLESWKPCAIGMLPDPLNHNGRLPLLVAETADDSGKGCQLLNSQNESSERAMSKILENKKVISDNYEAFDVVKWSSFEEEEESLVPLFPQHKDAIIETTETEEQNSSNSGTSDEDDNDSSSLRSPKTYDSRRCPPVKGMKLKTMAF